MKCELPVVQELQYPEEQTGRRNYRDLEEDNVMLLRKLAEKDMELHAVKASKKKIHPCVSSSSCSPL